MTRIFYNHLLSAAALRMLNVDLIKFLTYFYVKRQLFTFSRLSEFHCCWTEMRTISTMQAAAATCESHSTDNVHFIIVISRRSSWIAK